MGKPSTKTQTAAMPESSKPEASGKRALAAHEILASPEAQAAVRMNTWGSFAGNADLSEVILQMRADAKTIHGGDLGLLERMLLAQAVTLDTMFTSLARRAHGQEFLPQFQAFANLALRAQSQCRATVEALAEIKNPKAATFVRQANIAHQQQVNNGEAVLPAPAPAQLAAPVADALADTWAHTSEPVPASRARESRSTQSRLTPCQISGHPNAAPSRPNTSSG